MNEPNIDEMDETLVGGHMCRQVVALCHCVFQFAVIGHSLLRGSGKICVVA